jgi:hypothetical protein
MKITLNAPTVVFGHGPAFASPPGGTGTGGGGYANTIVFGRGPAFASPPGGTGTGGGGC